MMRERMCVCALMIVAACLAISAANAQSTSSLLSQYVADLQKTPNDYALREKIIKHVQVMKPAPTIPEAAREHYVMAATFMEKAKDSRGYERAIDQYRQALLAAPWWADAYKKQAITQKAAARYDDAIASLSLYILTQPADARDAQDEIYKLKALKQSAALDREESSPPAAPAPKQNTFDDLLRKIDGRRYIQEAGPAILSVIDVRGGVLVRGYIDNGRYHPWTGDAARVEIKGRETTVPIRDQPAFLKIRSVSMDFIISEDGDRIAARTHFSDGDVREYMHFWHR